MGDDDGMVCDAGYKSDSKAFSSYYYVFFFIVLRAKKGNIALDVAIFGYFKRI